MGPDDVVLDLGAGDGRVCIHACLAFGARGWGVEIDPSEAAKFRSNAARFGLDRRRCRVTEGDLAAALAAPQPAPSSPAVEPALAAAAAPLIPEASAADSPAPLPADGTSTAAAEAGLASLGEVTVVALYLLPEAIGALRPLLEACLARGARVAANTWGLPWRSAAASTHAEVGAGRVPLFLYAPDAPGALAAPHPTAVASSPINPHSAGS